jgi:dihydrofolate synthase/folylpolyglutamate synthase
LVLEVGIGGEWDSTNVANADVAVFTAIDLDHTKQLGNTVEEIASTKAGIIKEKSVVVSSPQKPSVAEVLRNRAQGDFLLAGQDFGLADYAAEGYGTRFSVNGTAGNYPSLWMPIIGAHQAENAATAIAAVEQFLGSRSIADEYLRVALADAVSPGRLQVISKQPLIVLDGAHNPAGIASLGNAISEHFANPDRIGLVAMVADKDIDSAAKQFAEMFPRVIVTQLEGERALPAEDLSSKIITHGGSVIATIPEVSKALQFASETAKSEEIALFVTGSLYLIGAVLEELQVDDDEE